MIVSIQSNNKKSGMARRHMPLSASDWLGLQFADRNASGSDVSLVETEQLLGWIVFIGGTVAAELSRVKFLADAVVLPDLPVLTAVAIRDRVGLASRIDYGRPNNATTDRVVQRHTMSVSLDRLRAVAGNFDFDGTPVEIFRLNWAGVEGGECDGGEQEVSNVFHGSVSCGRGREFGWPWVVAGKCLVTKPSE